MSQRCISRSYPPQISPLRNSPNVLLWSLREPLMEVQSLDSTQSLISVPIGSSFMGELASRQLVTFHESQVMVHQFDSNSLDWQSNKYQQDSNVILGLTQNNEATFLLEDHSLWKLSPSMNPQDTSERENQLLGHLPESDYSGMLQKNSHLWVWTQKQASLIDTSVSKVVERRRIQGKLQGMSFFEEMSSSNTLVAHNGETAFLCDNRCPTWVASCYRSQGCPTIYGVKPHHVSDCSILCSDGAYKLNWLTKQVEFELTTKEPIDQYTRLAHREGMAWRHQTTGKVYIRSLSQ